MKEISIFIADDHAMVRQGLRAVLEAHGGFRVVGEASTGQQTLDRLQSSNPDLILLDLILPGLDGLEVARLCRKRFPKLRILMLSMYANPSYVFRAKESGVNGYALKSCDASVLITAILEVMAGRFYLSPPLNEEQVQAYARQSRTGKRDLYETLTKREREILQLATEGLTNVRMGEHLGISPRTVEVHRSNLMKKLQLKNHSELVRYAFSRGMFPQEHAASTVPAALPSTAQKSSSMMAASPHASDSARPVYA